MAGLEVFFAALAGSVSQELATMHFLFTRDEKLPPRYSSWAYGLVRLALAIAAGYFAQEVAGFDSTLKAFFLGVGMPVVILKIAEASAHLFPPDRTL